MFKIKYTKNKAPLLDCISILPYTVVRLFFLFLILNIKSVPIYHTHIVQSGTYFSGLILYVTQNASVSLHNGPSGIPGGSPGSWAINHMKWHAIHYYSLLIESINDFFLIVFGPSLYLEAGVAV